MGKELLFLDADGVLLDSVDEAILSSWNGYLRLNGFREPILDLDDVPGKIVDGMRLYRPSACTFLDILRILHALATEQDLSLAESSSLEHVVSLDGVDAQRFKENVDQFRRHELVAHPDNYRKVMRVYREAADHYAQLVTSLQYVVYIVTNKLPEHVAAALQAFSYPIFEDKIVNGNISGSKNDQIHTVIQRAGIPLSETHFIDDYVHALVGVKNDPHLQGIHVYLAGWGYVNNASLKLAQREKIPVLQQSDLVSCFPLH